MVTMQQVADRAGVSISTVSFLVNDTKPVAPETRDRILRAIDELGYRRNAAARALASRRSRVLALLYPLVDHNLDLFVEAAARVAEERGYNLVVWPVNPDRVSTVVTSLIQTRMADGVLLLEVLLDDDRVRRLQAADAPFVLIGRTRDLEGIDYVDIDFERTTTDAIDQLTSLGHRSLTLVTEDFDRTPLAGYAPPTRVESTFTAVAAARGLDAAVIRVPRDIGRELVLADRVVEEAPDTTGILIMHSDGMFALANGLRRRAIAVPRDVSIASIASATSLAALMDPPVTSWDAPGSELGALAAGALIDRLEKGERTPTQTLVPCIRIDGASVGRVPDGRPPLNRFPLDR